MKRIGLAILIAVVLAGAVLYATSTVAILDFTTGQPTSPYSGVLDDYSPYGCEQLDLGQTTYAYLMPGYTNRWWRWDCDTHGSPSPDIYLEANVE